MKRERSFDIENEPALNATKKSERIIDKDNKQKHTVWCLAQSQKHLNAIIKEYCSLCNRRLKDQTGTSAGGDRCDYCGRRTCSNINCELSKCGICELPICNLCGSYNYNNYMSSNLMFCPSCL
ncbi:hypothetical protein OIY81_1124 [Cryptosporidium canis]|uniref:Zinc-finger domain-containing protein n=1 Tax=Cryptosporidium canis TaxID=195482 RepID=A0ABQ8P2T6_9CRYT|nr:hypothetical protein OJ252_3633 [Cryptosporidium canis]KAJ1612900.1 hypothetical protein OIY81_1124 [Cryptosporidium canis]